MQHKALCVSIVALCLGALGCHRPPVAQAALVNGAATVEEALQSAPNVLALYDAVLRALSASYPGRTRPPVESSIMQWQFSEPGVSYSAPIELFATLPDTFLTRLAREGVTGGICPAPRCRRVPSAISLSPPRSVGALVVVQASLDGTGLDQYTVRLERGRWVVLRCEQLGVY